jgi:hypothetical protein
MGCKQSSAQAPLTPSNLLAAEGRVGEEVEAVGVDVTMGHLSYSELKKLFWRLRWHLMPQVAEKRY